MAKLLSDAVKAFTDNSVPVAHVRFKTTQAPPYAEAYMDESEHFHADNKTSRALVRYEIVLHVVERNLRLEGLIEDALDVAEIAWRKRGGYKADEDLITTTYEMSVYER